MSMLTIDQSAPWRIYWGAGPLPAGSEALGTVRRGIGDTGALVKMRTGIYVQGNAGALRSLPQRDVRLSLVTPPRT